MQLADVAAPVVALEPVERGVGEGFGGDAVAARDLGEDELGDERDVALALAQRRHVDEDDREPVVEVLAERALADLGQQILVRRRDDADVDVDRAVAADAGDPALLQRAEHLRLRVEAHVADLVEEERAAVGLLELPDALLRRARERCPSRARTARSRSARSGSRRS